jgi:hypothetical protein
MPGVPPNSPKLLIPRFANGDDADFAGQVNSVVDHIDGLFSAFVAGLLNEADAAAFRAAIGAAAVGAGDYQAHDLDLDAIAALPSAADKLPYATGPQAWALTTLSAFMRTLLDDADPPTARTTLGAGPQIQRASTKPSAPRDGDLWLYPASPPYCEWLMRYDAANAMWKYIGGQPIQVVTRNAETRPDNGLWGDTATPLSYTVPFAGAWAVRGLVGLAYPQSYGCELDVAANPRGLGADGSYGAALSPTTGGQGAAIPVPENWWAGFNAGDTIKLQYWASQQGGGGYTATFRYRQMYIKPLYIT